MLWCFWIKRSAYIFKSFDIYSLMNWQSLLLLKGFYKLAKYLLKRFVKTE